MSAAAKADPKRAARAIDALRRGWPIALKGKTDTLFLHAIETLAADAAALNDAASPSLMISPQRAATLKIVNQRAAADMETPVMLKLVGPLTIERAIAIADPALDLAWPMKGPFRAEPLADPEAATAALDLARHAGLLPAFVVTSDADDDADTVSTADVAAYADAGSLTIAARARLPVAAAETAEIVAFRSRADAREHLALIVGKRRASPPVVRLHSECLTGDALGSLKCDCGPQLNDALAQMANEGWGVLLYLRQEGRDIGLINKLRAYMLQDQGFDTVDANQRLGFANDKRDFSIAARMLALLSIEEIRLLSNNPEKQSGLEAAGIRIAERLALRIDANPHNARYLDTKRDRSGHQL